MKTGIYNAGIILVTLIVFVLLVWSMTVLESKEWDCIWQILVGAGFVCCLYKILQSDKKKNRSGITLVKVCALSIGACFAGPLVQAISLGLVGKSSIPALSAGEFIFLIVAVLLASAYRYQETKLGGGLIIAGVVCILLTALYPAEYIINVLGYQYAGWFSTMLSIGYPIICVGTVILLFVFLIANSKP